MTIEVSSKRGDRRGRSPANSDTPVSCKPCPFPQCGHLIDRRLFCCSVHWKRLPVYMRNEASNIYYAHNSGRLSDAEAGILFAELRAACGFNGETPPEARSSYGVACKRCGQLYFGADPPVNWGVRFGEKLLLAPADDGEFVVVGGTAVVVTEEAKLSPVLARMEIHRCTASLVIAKPPAAASRTDS